MILNQQSLMVNRAVADIAGDYLLRLTTVRPLRKFATYFDQESGTQSTKYVTPEQVGQVIGQPASYLMLTRSVASSEIFT